MPKLFLPLSDVAILYASLVVALIGGPAEVAGSGGVAGAVLLGLSPVPVTVVLDGLAHQWDSIPIDVEVLGVALVVPEHPDRIAADLVWRL